jgi:hypothetical protein
MSGTALSLRLLPANTLTVTYMTLSIVFRRFISSSLSYGYGVLTFTLTELTPTGRIHLCRMAIAKHTVVLQAGKTTDLHYQFYGFIFDVAANLQSYISYNPRSR